MFICEAFCLLVLCGFCLGFFYNSGIEFCLYFLLGSVIFLGEFQSKSY